MAVLAKIRADTGGGDVAPKRPTMPTVGKRKLARELVRLREGAQKTQEDVATELDWARGKVSNFENGQWTRASLTDLRAMLNLYGLSDEKHRASLEELMQDAKTPGWWTKYGDVFSNSKFPAFEDEASQIQTYEPNAVPGLLQTHTYASTLIRCDPSTQGKDAERRLEARMERQRLLEREHPPTLLFVLEESALWHLADMHEVFTDQLQHIIDLAKADNSVTIQIVPLRSGLHAAVSGPFVLMDFEGAAEMSVVCVETAVRDLYLEEKSEISYYRVLTTHLCGAALSTQQSISLLQKILDREKPTKRQT